MFVDKVTVSIKAGDGGNGLLSFRREKFIDKGGPDGGNGGNGGSVVLRASRNQNTLANFRYKKLLQAKPGQAGGKRKMHGRNGDDIIVEVPVGTVVTDSQGQIIADLAADNQYIVAAAGGRGGFGNAHFISSTRQAPRIVEKGEKGEEREVILELKMIADVGLIGLPNAGKSTLLAAVSNARPEIANYPFTTVKPNLGMVDIDPESSLLFADIPGLIEGASEGKGLGDEFLRHIERTQVLLHLIDAYNEHVSTAYKTIQEELRAYKTELAKRPQIVVLTKIEGLDAEIIADKERELKKVVPKSVAVTAISASSKAGLKELLFTTKAMVQKERARLAKPGKKADKGLPVISLKPEVSQKPWRVIKKPEGFIVSGHKIERFAARTDFGNYHALQRLRDIMKKMGIIHELERQNIEIGDIVKVGQEQFKY